MTSGSVAGTVALAMVLFVATNVDSLLTTAASIAVNNVHGRTGTWRIWLGQCLGMAIVAVVALLAAAGFAEVSPVWLAAIGVVPILLGVKGLWEALRGGDDGGAPAAAPIGVLGVVGLTLSNGTDNLAAYAPVFRDATAPQLAVTLAVFAVGAVLWCAVASWCASRRVAARAIQRVGRWLVPVVFLVVGCAAVYRGLSSS